MGYLTRQDYIIDINLENLNDFLLDSNGNINNNILKKGEKIAEEEIVSYLGMRFDMSVEFTNTTIWSNTATYSAGNLVYLDAGSYSQNFTYSINQLTSIDNLVYICSNTTSGTFSVSDWSLIGSQYDLFYTKYPAPLFDMLNDYITGDIVFWDPGITYSCNQPTLQMTNTQANQYLSISNIPNKNIVPDDKIANATGTYWLLGASQSYVIPAGTLPTNTNYWINDDNRCQMVMLRYIDMVLYYIEKTIAPRNISPLRITAYHNACEWLEEVANGKISVKLDELQKNRVLNIRSGGGTPTNFRY